MGDRRMFTDLMADPAAVPVQRLSYALAEIASGTHSFGALDEWRDWFHYLLPLLVLRGHERFVEPLVEPAVTAFISQHPTGLDQEPYAGFGEDALNTLGLCLMDGACWPGGELDADLCLNRRPDLQGLWGWDEPSGALSASMFFCLKYLRPEQLDAWFGSVFRIEAPQWRAQVMAWLIGAHRIFTGQINSPARFSLEDYPCLAWDWSHVLSGHYLPPGSPTGEEVDFIPAANRKAALSIVSRHFTDAAIMEWLDSFALDSAVEAEAASLAPWFHDLYRPLAA